MRQNLKKDYFWNTLGSAATACTSFVLTVIIARINNIEDIGLYTFAFGMAVIFAMISFFGGRNFQITDAKNEFTAEEYIAQRVVASAIAIFVTVVFILLNQYDLYVSMFIIILLLYKILDSCTDVVAATLQKKHHLWIAGKSGFFKAVFSVTLFTVIDLLTHDILISSLAFIFVYAVGMMTYDRHWLKQLNAINLKSKDINIRQLFRSTYLMAIILVLQVATINILRYFVQIFQPDQQGIFGIIILPAFIINLLGAFIVSPQLTSLTELFHKKETQKFTATVHKILLTTTGIGVFLVLLAYFLAVPVVKLIYGYDFSSYNWLITLSVIAGIFYAISVIYFSIITILRRIKSQVVILGGVLILEIIFALIFGRVFGIEAMVIIYLFAQFIQAVASYFVYNLSVGGGYMQSHSTLLNVLEFGRNFNKKLFKNRFTIFFMRQILTIQAYVMMLIYAPTFIATGKKYIKKYRNLNYEQDGDIKKLLDYKSEEVKIGKTIWQFWDSGYKNVPEGIKVCIDRVQEIAKNSEFDYVLITDENIEKYIYTPEFILKKYRTGKITKPHFSDIVRMSLLSKYGGLWIDTTYYVSQKVNLNIAKCNFFTLHKKWGAFAGNPAMCRWLQNFIGSDVSEYRLFKFCLAGFYKYWRNHEEMPKEYLFIDYLILTFYKTNKEFRKNLKSLKSNFKGVASMSLLSNYFHNSVIYSKKNEKRLLSQADLYHKLDFKYSKQELNNGKETFYKKFIDRKLDI